MLTPKDLVNARRKSGYNFVGYAASATNPAKKPYQAMKRPSKDATGNRAIGPRRATAIEAAQDYCDWYNSLPNLTPADIKNPSRKSGYDHVGGGDRPGRRNRPRPWNAQHYSGGRTHPSGGGLSWFGPYRATPLEAAQDYCNYINGQRSSNPSLPAYAAVQIDMGNTKRHAPKPESVKVVREKFTGPHDVYDVLFVTANGDTVCRKVGITARGHARYADVCKTLGMSIRPVQEAKTYPTEEAARVAESAKVAEVCADKAWRRIGKEAFAPVIKSATEGADKTNKEVTTT